MEVLKPMSMKPLVPWKGWCVLISFSVAGATLVNADETLPPSAGPTLVVSVSGPIHPVAAEVIARAVGKAREDDAALLVIELDTPGGLMSSMQDIKKAILNSPVPVAVFVSPKGAQAASAGFFIVMSADLAVMAPGTSTGAAHPVDISGGEEISEVMGKKILHSAVKELQSVAEVRGRNPELAIEAVQGEVKSFTAEEALAEGLIDFIAEDVHDLIRKANDRAVTRFTGEEEVLTLDEREIVELEQTLRERVLGAIANPNVLFLLLGLGVLGLYVEISNPGLILPGVVGGICIILALFSMQALPINYAGVLLMLLSFVLFLVELKVASYGLLTLGGILSLLLGGMLLIKEPVPGLAINWTTLISVAVFIGALVALVVYLVVRAHGEDVWTGQEGMVGKRGVAATPVHREGRVFVQGEYWRAISAAPIEKDEPVEIVGVSEMTLKVQRVTES